MVILLASLGSFQLSHNVRKVTFVVVVIVLRLCWMLLLFFLAAVLVLVFVIALLLLGLVVVVVINVGPRNLTLKFGQNEVSNS